jgi:hypothetical protein
MVRRIFGPVYGNGLGWGTRHNKEVCELLDEISSVQKIAME